MKNEESTNMPEIDPSIAEGPRREAGESRFPRLLTVADVQEILNVGMRTVLTLLGSGELRGFQFGGRKMWRISEADLEAYIERCYRQTEESIAAGDLPTESSTQ